MSFYYSAVVGAKWTYACKQAFVQLHQITNSKVDHFTETDHCGKKQRVVLFIEANKNRPHQMDPAEVDDEAKCHILLKCLTILATKTQTVFVTLVEYLYDVSFIQGQSCQEREVEPVSLSSYCYIFCNNFNLGFGMPKSDTCSLTLAIQLQMWYLDRSDYTSISEMQKNWLAVRWLNCRTVGVKFTVLFQLNTCNFVKFKLLRCVIALLHISFSRFLCLVTFYCFSVLYIIFVVFLLVVFSITAQLACRQYYRNGNVIGCFK